MSKFIFSSPALCDTDPIPMEFIYDAFGCTGGNQSPPLEWKNAPEGTKSFAITIFDLDAPTGSGWWHWQIYNIPAILDFLPQNASADLPVPAANAKQTRNDYSNQGYGGPCPPEGDAPHRYLFTLHALSVESLDLPLYASAALAGFMFNSNTIETATFVIPYGR